MAEDPEREARRHNLSKQKKKLAEAQKWLATVHNVDEDEEMKSPSEVTMDGRDQIIDWAWDICLKELMCFSYGMKQMAEKLVLSTVIYQMFR